MPLIGTQEGRPDEKGKMPIAVQGGREFVCKKDHFHDEASISLSNQNGYVLAPGRDDGTVAFHGKTVTRILYHYSLL